MNFKKYGLYSLWIIFLFSVIGCGTVETDCDCPNDGAMIESSPTPTVEPIPTVQPTPTPIVQPTPTPTVQPTPTLNSSPIAKNQKVITEEDKSLPVVLIGEDSDGDTLSYILTTQPAHGTLSGTAPHLTYIPNANYHGDDSFTFKVNDGSIDSMEATISIVVTPINDKPIANDDIST